ncbi:LysR substrate-binding domain-containing protein [Paraburkholderia fungorum]|uniref:LysR substrate-binding domain-containing protein n=1 Tax=Paraburkholderia fungorum TaxID=134537 RepID=UPI0038BB8A5C
MGWRRTGRPGWLIAGTDGETSYFDVRARHELTDGDALLCACISGCGLAQLPGWLAKDGLRTGALREVLPELSTTMPIYAIWQKTRHLQPKVKVAVDELVRLSLDEALIFSP